MVRRVIEGLVILALLLVGGTIGLGRFWTHPGDGFYWRVASLTGAPDDTGPTDFARLHRRSSPNDALVCPESACPNAKPDGPAPIFPVPATELRRKVSLVALSEPDSVELTCADGCDHVARFVEYSPLFQFPDVIDVVVIDAGAKASTLAIYSRSVIGKGDLGVNKARVDRWLAALTRIMPRQ